ncbi:unnamed protein product [Penicillium bialowiezense]
MVLEHFECYVLCGRNGEAETYGKVYRRQPDQTGSPPRASDTLPLRAGPGEGNGRWSNDNFYIHFSQGASGYTDLQVIGIVDSKSTKVSTAAVHAGKTVPQIQVPIDGPWIASQIRQEPMSKRKI